MVRLQHHHHTYIAPPPRRRYAAAAGIAHRSRARIARRYNALSSSIAKNGFKAALLLRLAPVLPIPLDAHW